MQFNIPAEHKNASGVYIIRNTVNDKVYVGSAVNFKRRHKDHLSQFRRSTHHSPLLANFASKHGVEVLSFNLLELVNEAYALRERLLSCEQKWLDELKPYVRWRGFNICPIAGSSLGAKQSEATRLKMSRARTGLRPTLSEEQRAARSQAIRDWWANRSEQEKKVKPESIAKREATRKANQAITPRRKWSDEAKQKASEQRKGMNAGTKWSAERIAKRTATLKANRLKAQGTEGQLKLL